MKPPLYPERKQVLDGGSHSVPLTHPTPQHAAHGRGSGSFRAHHAGSRPQSSVLLPGQLLRVAAWELVTVVGVLWGLVLDSGRWMDAKHILS